MSHKLEFKWSRVRSGSEAGFDRLTLRVNGERAASCTGGGYDMNGTVLGDWVAVKFRDRLQKMPAMRGLTWHDPNYDSGKAVVPNADGRTVEDREKTHDSIGLERYQATYRGASDVATDQHMVPSIDGACGIDAVRRIIEAMGGVYDRKTDTYAEVYFND